MSTLPESTIEAPEARTVEYRLEVVVLPVADTDRAKAFYASLGWREDADFPIRDGFRVVQMTPPGSPASIIFGTGVTAPDRGPIENMVLAVYDIEAARADLVARGVDVSELFHSSGFDHDADRAYGADPERQSYSTFASFRDANVTRMDTPRTVGTLAALLRETAEHHDAYEKATPPHDWWDWYAPYLDARERGLAPEAAVAAADRYMAALKGITRRPARTEARAGRAATTGSSSTA